MSKDQYRSREFADASVAVCALVAAADGSVGPTERQRTASLIVSNDASAVFPPEELKTMFGRYCDKLNRDFDFGKVDAIASIGKLREKLDQARAIMTIGLVIGHADGLFDPADRRALSDASHAVGIAPSEFDL